MPWASSSARSSASVKGPRAANQLVAGKRNRLSRLVHQPHQKPEVRTPGEGRERADADGEEHALGLGRDRRRSLLHRVDVDPAIAGQRTPGRAYDHEPRGTGLSRRLARLGRDPRGKRMGGIDQEANPLLRR